MPLLEACVDSLLAQAGGERFRLRVVLVDNGSGLTPRLPPDRRLEYVCLPENRGFAGGYNAGMRHAFERGADYVLLFNSDAVAARDLVQRLVAAAEAVPSAAFLGPVVMRADAPDQIESAGQGFDTRLGRHVELCRGQRVGQFARTWLRQVDALSGCALLVRRIAAEAIGTLDGDLFAYFEDMEWCLRAREAGYRVLLVPGAKVWHHGQGSTGGTSSMTTYYSVRNHMRVAARYATLIPGACVMPLVLAYHLAYLARTPERRTPEHLVALARGAWSAWAGEGGPLLTGADRN